MPPGFKVVIDTNIFMSAVIFKGEANKLVPLWQKGEMTFLMSREILVEYINVLSYPKFKLADYEVKHIIEAELIPFLTLFEVDAELKIIKDDPSDNKFLSLAIKGKADYIVSGDRHLLDIGEFRKTRIVSSKKFLSLFPNPPAG